jgi:hypothetical protein
MDTYTTESGNTYTVTPMFGLFAVTRTHVTTLGQWPAGKTLMFDRVRVVGVEPRQVLLMQGCTNEDITDGSVQTSFLVP